MKYLVVVEQGPASFGVGVPDLPGCAAIGARRGEVIEVIHDAIEPHVEDLRQQGQPVPVPQSTGELVEIDG